VTVQPDATQPVVSLAGELDLDTVPKLRTALAPVLDETSTTNVTFDMRELEFIDSTGLRVLVDVVSRLGERGGKLAIRSPRPSTLKVLEICGLTQTITIDGA
jgi:anti-sigma B factor antagonist